MLPSWRDRLIIALGPEQVELVHVARGLRPRAGTCRLVSCGDSGWQGALAEVLQPAVRRNAVATVVLSNHLVRYQLVPWHEGLSGEEVAALVRHGFEQVYGDVAGGWDLRWHSDGPGQPWLACGVERGLLAELAAILDGAGVRLVSAQPYLMASFNRWYKEFGRGRQWFVLGEPGRATLCRIEDGVWRSIANHRLEQPWQEALPPVLRREIVLAGESAAPEQVLVRAAEGLAGEKSVRRLESVPPPGVSASEAARFAMALEGMA